MELKSITCDPMCGFMVRGHNEKELVELTMMHVRKTHPDKKVGRGELKRIIRSE